MKANPFNWTKQSREHRDYAAKHYPMLASMVYGSQDYPDFARKVQNLNPHQRQSYVDEWGRWQRGFGQVWEKMGCIKENRVGQFTSSRRWVDPGQRSSFGGFGAIMRPFLGNYMHECTQKPDGARYRSGPVSLAPVDPDWTVTYYDDKDMISGAVTYQHVKHNDGLDSYWAYPKDIPCGKSVTAAPGGKNTSAMVKEMQLALMDAGYPLPVYGADGYIGEETCNAALNYQWEKLGQDSSALGPMFFVSLGLPESYYLQISGVCSHLWVPQGGTAPEVPPEPYVPWLPEIPGGSTPSPPAIITVPETPVEPGVSKAGFGKAVAIGAAALLVLFAVTRKKKKKKKRRKSKRGWQDSKLSRRQQMRR